MNKLSLLSFAAIAALAATPAIAQVRGGHGGAGASWQGGGMRTGGGFRAGGGMNMHRGGNVQVRTGGGMNMHRGGGMTVRHGGPNVVVRHNGGGHFRSRHGGFHPGRNFPRRIHRGFTVHPFWFGQQFHINNWQAYGFADPGPDRRWVRYYDDAYLIDRGGRVVDERYGLDWDQYGERWSEEDGVPSYYGSREYTPGEEDYAWVDEHGGERDYDYADAGPEGPDGPPMMPPQDYGPGPAHGGGHGQVQAYGGGYGPGPAYGGGHGGYGYGYGAYGYGWAYPIVIETTVTTGGGYTEEITEEVVEVRRSNRPRRSCNCRRAAPVRHAPPPAGERG